MGRSSVEGKEIWSKESIDNFADHVKKQEESISKIAEELVDKLSSAHQKASGDIDSFYEGMLGAQALYLQEKQRLDAENAQREEANRRKEYQKRLASAKNATNAQLIRQKEALRLKKLSDEEYLDSLKQAAEKEKEILESLKSDIRDIYRDIAEYADDSIGSTVRAQDKMEEKLKDFGVLAKNITFVGMGPNGKNVVYQDLADLGQQINELKRYSELLSAVKTRMFENGFSSDNVYAFFSELADLSVEDGTKLAELLATAGTDKFLDYLGKWNQKQALAGEISSKLYLDQFSDSVDKTKQYMEEKLREAGLSIPEGFFVSGSVSAQNFGSAFVLELERQMDKVRELMASYSFSFEPSQASESGGEPQVVSNHSAITYIIKSSAETVARQLESARNHSELERMRNG
ncbi:MAG: hypothetical protein IJB48_03210 [Clostridia bacterium]|nr:hypothetical protein [Clostridia bacterium]